MASIPKTVPILQHTYRIYSNPGRCFFQKNDARKWGGRLRFEYHGLTAKGPAMTARHAPISGCRVQAVLHARPRLIFATFYGSCTVTWPLRLSGGAVVPTATQANRVVCFVPSIIPKSRSPTFMQRESSSRRAFAAFAPARLDRVT